MAGGGGGVLAVTHASRIQGDSIIMYKLYITLYAEVHFQKDTGHKAKPVLHGVTVS